MDYIELTEDMMPERCEPDWVKLKAAHKSEADFMEVAFYLLRETTHWLVIAGGLPLLNATDRDEAIRRGLMVRLTKLHRLVLRELHSQETFLQLGIARDVVETIATLNYLLLDSGGQTLSRYDQYVMNSLIAERELARDINENIRARGGSALDIESRMLRSIAKTAKAAGISDVLTIPARKDIGFPNIESRVRLLGPTAYSGYRMGSTEVHGDWVDLYRNHLRYKDGSYSPNLDSFDVRPQVPLMICRLTLGLVVTYFEVLFGKDPAVVQLEPCFNELMQRIAKVDELHEIFLQAL